MGMTETILEQFKEREKEIKKEAERLDAEMNGKRKAEERHHDDLLSRLTKKRAAHAAAVREYHVLDDELTAAAMEADAEGAAIGERVKAGEATLAEIIAAKEREPKARAAAHEKLEGAEKIIRALGTEIIGLEKEEAQSRLNLHYCLSYPATTQVQKLKAEVETLERGIGAVLESYTGASYDLERKEGDLRLCSGRFISGMVWNDLSYEELRDVRLDPRLHDRFLPDLEKIIAEARPEARYHLTLRSGLQIPGGGGAELTYREEIPEGCFITTRTAAEKKGGDK